MMKVIKHCMNDEWIFCHMGIQLDGDGEAAPISAVEADLS